MDAGSVARAHLALLAACLLACSYEHQYTDPDGPSSDGDYAVQDATRGDVLRVVSYNLAFGDQPDVAGEVLRAEPLAGADLILMQEMDDPAMIVVADAVDLRYIYYPASVKHGDDWGNGVLTPWPIVEHHKLLLPWADPFSNTHRIAASATIDYGGDPILVYSTHIATPSLGLGARLDQIEAILIDAGVFQLPTVIGGDLNTADPGSQDQVLELFAEYGYVWASRDATDTGSAFGSDATLDYIFVRGLEPGASGTFRGDAGSDHRPIWAELEPP